MLAVVFLVGSPLVGRWADRTGQGPRAVVAGLVLAAVGIGGLWLARSAGALGASALVAGVAVALTHAPLTALVGDAAPPGARGAMMGAYATLSDLASAAGAILGTTTALAVGFTAAYLAAAVCVALAAGLLASRLGYPPRPAAAAP